MARSRLCRCCGDFHDLAKPWPHNCVSHFGTIASDAPAVRSDGMDPTLNHADNRMYDSKSAYYRAVERAGCHIVEPGSHSRKSAPSGPPVRETMRQVIQQLSSR